MTEIEQLLWAIIYRDKVKAYKSQRDAVQAANDAVDNLREANEQDS